MEITNKWLKEKNACQEAKDWLKTIKDRNINNIFNLIISSKDNEKLSWGNWGIVSISFLFLGIFFFFSKKLGW